MTLPLNPIGISTLPDIRDRVPMLAAAAKLKKGPKKKNNAAAASAADAANASGRGVGMYQFARYLTAEFLDG